MNATFVKNNIPAPFNSYFPFKYWKWYELYVLDKTVTLDADNMNNEVRTRSFSFFKNNGVEFKDDMIQVIFDLQWTLEDAVTKEVVTTIDPSFKVSFIVDVTDMGKKADNINLKIYNVEAVPSTHGLFPTSDEKLFISLLSWFAYGIERYLNENLFVFGKGFTNYILTHYEHVFHDY